MLLFSNKMKGSFLFYGDTKQFFTTLTDKYRINDVTIIYRIGPLYILMNFVVCEYYLGIRIYSNEFISIYQFISFYYQ